MNVRDLGPAILAFSQKIQEGIPSLFNRGNEMVINATYGETSELSKWIQREKFANFMGMQVPVPPGLNVYVSDHLAHLEKVWGPLSGIVEGVLKPTDATLARFANETGMLTVPGAFKFSQHRYALGNIDPADLIAMLTKDFSGNALDQRAFEKTYRSANELENTFVRARALTDGVTKGMRKDVNRLVESISSSADAIANSNVHPSMATELSKLIDATNAWIELLGLFMKQTQELVTCMNLTTDQIKALTERDKK